jgi:hypothetical protein
MIQPQILVGIMFSHVSMSFFGIIWYDTESMFSRFHRCVLHQIQKKKNYFGFQIFIYVSRHYLWA